MHTSARRADVARKAGVAESTVSRALNDSPLISPATREKVRRTAQELGYVPSQQAALFARNKTYRLGFVIPNYEAIPPFSRPYLPTLLDGVVMAAEEQGYSIAIILEHQNGHPKNLSKTVKGREVDGLILAVTKAKDERIDQLRYNHIPFVLINTSRNGCNSVDNNPESGMRQAFEYTAQMGHRRLGYISGDMEYQNAADRLKAFQSLAKEFAMEAAIKGGNFSRTSGYYCTGKLLQTQNRPSLIMTSCDREALGVLSYCRDHGIAVPGQVGVIGYDNLDPASLLTPALTTIDNPITQIGRTSVKILIRYLENKTKRPVAKRLETGFVIRESSGKCNQ